MVCEEEQHIDDDATELECFEPRCLDQDSHGSGNSVPGLISTSWRRDRFCEKPLEAIVGLHLRV